MSYIPDFPYAMIYFFLIGVASLVLGMPSVPAVCASSYVAACMFSVDVHTGVH